MNFPRFKLSTKLWLGMSAPLLGISLSFAATDQYRVMSGDTLSEIAESRYGNWVKWHDLYSANKDVITNPDLIYPGQRLRLLTDEEVAFFRDKNDLYASNGSNGSNARRRPRGALSQEWRLLPLQNWEKFVFQKSAEIDPQGFDRRSKVAVRVATDTNAEATIASDRLAIQGEIVNARTDYAQVFLGEQVFIRADEELQVGTVYSTTTGPQKMTSTRDGRVGFAYDVTGQVRIIGVRDGLFIGTVIALYSPIERHQLLIPKVNPYPLVKANAAPAPINATVLVTENARESLIGEQRVVFLDVGTQDGVKTGMVFRHYLHRDPRTKEEISSKDFLIESELQVLSVQEKFSAAIVLRSRSSLRANEEVVALTELTDFEKNAGLQTLIQDRGTGNTLDDLDRMDETQGLGEKEDRELRQLENYSSPTPESTLQPTTPSASDDIQVEGKFNHQATDNIGSEPAPNDGSNSNPPPQTVIEGSDQNSIPEPPVIDNTSSPEAVSESPPGPSEPAVEIPAPEVPVVDPFANPAPVDPALDEAPQPSTSIEGSTADPAPTPTDAIPE